MKISNSKKELARIISENGGWRDGAEFTAQDGDGTGSIDFFKSNPRYDKDDKFWKGEYDLGERIKYAGVTIKNFHQTILSSEEYFHLYPATDANAEFCESVTRSIPEPESKPTIEQLAADYRNRKDYADRKQEEADAAKAEAEAKLVELVAAGKALNLVISVDEEEPELDITDWRQLRYGDFIWVASEDASEDGYIVEGEYEVLELERAEYDGTRAIRVERDGFRSYWINIDNGWRFIRRP